MTEPVADPGEAVTPAPRAALRRSSPLTEYLLAPNPGPMSLEGTNSYLLSATDAATAVVVDPGPPDDVHLKALAAAGEVELILITHRHHDHTDGAKRLSQLTGAPVRAADRSHCHGGGAPLTGGETINAGGVRVRVLATPGHTSDSLSFHLPDDGPAGSILTGDTILGRGTTVLDFPDGTLRDYLASLDLLEGLGGATVLPAHGPVPADDIGTIVRAYREHRLQRLAQVRHALAALGPQASASEVAAVVYSDVDPSVRRAAELSVAAQLEYLRG